MFADSRVNPAREFFKLSPEKVVLAIQMGSFEEVTPGKANLPADEEAAKEKAEELRRKGDRKSTCKQLESYLEPS